jgi:DNA polymerase III subunit delta
MTAIKAFDVDKFINRPDIKLPVVLVYGPDAGLVRERVDALVKASVDNPNDPFALARIESEELSVNPGRLADEVNTVPLFGGRRAVLLKVNSRHNIIPSVEAVLQAVPPDCRIIIEAGELRKTAPLRTVLEKAKAAATIACYPDNENDLGRVIDQEMREAQLILSDEARSALTALLGGDRLGSRSEIRKLALYCKGQRSIGLADVMAVVADASALALDGVIDATFAGNTVEVEIEFGKARAGGSSPAAIISAAIRQVASLHKMKLAIESGETIELAMKRFVPPVHFTREKNVGSALRGWSSVRLLRAMAQLAEASLDMRRNAALAEVIGQRTLLSIAVSLRRKEN